MTTLPAPLPAEAVEAVLATPGGVSLPAEAYTSQELLAWELRHFFAGSWVCVARAESLGEPGQQEALRIGGEGVLLVRGTDGELRAFSNVCRHRGHELLPPGGRAQARVVRCPYHAWVYDLEGQLRTAPRFGGEVDTESAALVPARVAQWQGWVFVNADGAAPALADHIGDLDGLVAAHDPARLRVGASRRYEVAANWKILAENYHECYHCPSIHPELCRVTPPDSGETFTGAGAWVGGSMDLRDAADTMSLNGSTGADPLPGLDAQGRREVRYLDLFPGLMLSLHPDYVLTHRLAPLAVDRTLVECEWLFAPEALARPGFDPAYAVDFWDVTNAQDWRACESVQRGATSRGYRQGPLSAQELSLRRFLDLVAEGYRTGAVPLERSDAFTR